MGPPVSTSLSAGIVTYGPLVPALSEALSSLDQALALCGRRDLVGRERCVLVDNGPGDANVAPLRDLCARLMREGAWEVVSGHGNVGYGAGQNLAWRRSRSEYHLVMNPDVVLEESALAEAVEFMWRHPDVGLVAPAVFSSNGRLQYLCRRYPSVLDLLLRGFAPRWLRRWFDERLTRYEMRDVVGTEAVVWDPPLVSGCFMLFRRSVLESVGGFDPRYFLYFEDYDLTLRVARVARVAYVPSVRIVHHGGNASGKGFGHTRMFIRSAVRFFGAHGWRLA